MRTRFEKGARIVLFVLTAVGAGYAARAVWSRAGAAEVVPMRRQEAPAHDPAATPPGPDQTRIHELDERIKGLRDQFKAQADPLQAQLKALREKLDADLKPLQDERKELADRSKSPALRSLDDDEAGQLAALADREKADVEKVHQDYAQQRTTLKATFDQKRRDLRAAVVR